MKIWPVWFLIFLSFFPDSRMASFSQTDLSITTRIFSYRERDKNNSCILEYAHSVSEWHIHYVDYFKVLFSVLANYHKKLMRGIAGWRRGSEGPGWKRGGGWGKGARIRFGETGERPIWSGEWIEICSYWGWVTLGRTYRICERLGIGEALRT